MAVAAPFRGPERRPPRLILARHGQASLGSDDYDRLSERGHRQARRLAARLAPYHGSGAELWSGTLLRHQQTLTPLVAGASGARRSGDLDEFSTDGLVRAALAQAAELELELPPRYQLVDPVKHLDPLLAWFPQVLAAWQAGGLTDPAVGTWADFQQRVMRASRQWEASLRAGNSVIVVTSAGVIATLLAGLVEQDLAWQRELAVALYNASVSELGLEEGAWQIKTLNCVRHLGGGALRTRA